MCGAPKLETPPPAAPPSAKLTQPAAVRPTQASQDDLGDNPYRRLSTRRRDRQTGVNVPGAA